MSELGMRALPIVPRDDTTYIRDYEFSDRDDGSIEITFFIAAEHEPETDCTFVWPQDSLADFVSTLVSRSSLGHPRNRQ